MNTIKPKEAKLKHDEFNPHKAFKSFWRLPRAVAAHERLSLGAKVLYATLAGLAGSYGTSYPSRKKLSALLGGVSHKTLYNWQRELVVNGMIRVNQKGRGLPNNYYFIRNPIFDNAEEYELLGSERCLYTGPQTSEPIAVDVDTARQLYKADVQAWYEKGIAGEQVPFPKPCWIHDRKTFKLYKEEMEGKVLAYIDAM